MYGLFILFALVRTVFSSNVDYAVLIAYVFAVGIGAPLSYYIVKKDFKPVTLGKAFGFVFPLSIILMPLIGLGVLYIVTLF